jgi:hypothetical protein
MNLLDKVKSEGFKCHLVLGIKPTGFPFFVILAPTGKPEQSDGNPFGGLIEN